VAEILASRLADAMPILHASSAFLEDMTDGPHFLEVSENGRSFPRTREAEEILGWPPALYLYAGRCYPRVKNKGVVFAFGPRSERGRTGSVSPFDSGSMVLGRIRSELGSEFDPTETTQRTIIELCRWRAEFGRFLAAHFPAPATYLSRSVRPVGPDPDRVLCNSQNTSESWTFEVRFWEKLDIIEAERWCCTREQMSSFDDKISRLPLHEQRRWEEYKKRAEAPSGSPDYVSCIEDWVRKEADRCAASAT